MTSLPLELGLFVVAYVQTARAWPAHIQLRDNDTPCTGKYSSLNTDGVSPSAIYYKITSACYPPSALDLTACKCNLLVYNLREAGAYCQQEGPITWSKWASNNGCPNNTVPPLGPGFDIGNLHTPAWATQALSSDGMFDVEAALKSSGGHGWTATQIAVPIVTGVGVAIIAALLFLWYRNRKLNEQSRYAHSRSPSSTKPWYDANLRGRRRIFGLFPVRYKVQPRPRSNRDDSWSIDDTASTVAFADFDSSRAPSRMTAFSTDLGPRVEPTHSRNGSESRASSFSSSPSQRSKQTMFSALASRINGLTSVKAYTSGTTKGADYRRVNVVPLTPYQSFRIDGLEGPTPSGSGSGRFSNGRASPGTPPAQRQDSFRSVVDIRREHPLVDSRQATQDTEFLQTPPSAWGTNHNQWNPESDYSLGSSDYVTPSVSESPTSSFHPHRLLVNAASPLLPRNQLASMPEETDSPFALPYRNPSTDTMAYEVYPREPRSY